MAARRRLRYDLTRGDAYFPSRADTARPPRRRMSDYAIEGARYPEHPVATVYPWSPSRSLRAVVSRGFSFAPKARGFSLALAQARLPWSDDRLRIRVPTRVKFCVARKQRREVLFAMERAGYSGSAPKRHYRRNEDSNWRC